MRSPQPAAIERFPNALRLSFTQAAGGLVLKDDGPGEFALCGENRVWHRAHVKVLGDTVVVSSSTVLNPVAVRCAGPSTPPASPCPRSRPRSIVDAVNARPNGKNPSPAPRLPS